MHIHTKKFTEIFTQLYSNGLYNKKERKHMYDKKKKNNNNKLTYKMHTYFGSYVNIHDG